jgi:hypothetical protein
MSRTLKNAIRMEILSGKYVKRNMLLAFAEEVGHKYDHFKLV